MADDNPLFRKLWAACRMALDQVPERRSDLDRLGRLMEGRRRQNQAFFDRHARQWDSLAGSLLPVVPFRELLLTRVPRCATLLEVGVGTGLLLEGLRRKAAAVIGVDHSPAMLAEARRQLPDLELDIAGRGPLEPALKAIAHELGVGDSVHFLGQVSPIQVAIQRSVAVVVPSMGEGFGMVALEAMERARPVIAAEIGLSSAIRGRILLPLRRIASIASGMPWPRIASEP